MALEEYFAKRWIHGVIIVAMAGLVMGPAANELIPDMGRQILGIAPIITWSLGVVYQRNLLIVTGTVDREELREAEKERSRLFEG